MSGSPGGPLVEPGPELTAAERDRYARHLLLPGFGSDAQRRLRAARVAVVGAGGLGSPVLAYLAAAGVGELVVIDDDVVETSNLQRQVLHGVASLDRPKVDSAAEAVARIDPSVRVVRHRERLTDATADRLLAGADLVVDGADNFATRYAVADACTRLGVPEVFGSVLRFDAQVGVFWAGRGATYRDVFPAPPPAGSVASCAEAGVLGALCGVVGSVMAVEAVKLLAGVGEPLVGRLLVLDALAMTWRTVRVRAGDPAAPVVAVAPEPEPLPADAVVTAPQLARLLAQDAVLLVDLRTDAEREVAVLPGAVPVPLDDVLAGTADLPADRRVVLHCRSGARSERAVRALRASGHPDAAHLDGGLLAWAALVDPRLAT